MGWRLSESLKVLLSEVNAKYPDRDKRTDGTISGYPGAISSHNINSLGVVNALDITVGDYPGGITHAQALIDTEFIRQSIKYDPRGYDAYVIYEARIADGFTGEWRKYTGERHTSHYHVSSAHDIPMGGVTLGDSDYDITIPWLSRGGDEVDPKALVQSFFEFKITVDGKEGRVLDWVVVLISKALKKK